MKCYCVLIVSVGLPVALQGLGTCSSRTGFGSPLVCNDEPVSLLQTHVEQTSRRSLLEKLKEDRALGGFCKSAPVQNVEYVADSYPDVPRDTVRSGIDGKSFVLAYPDDVILTDPSIIEIPAKMTSHLGLPSASRYLVSTTHFRGLPWEIAGSPGCIGVKQLPKNRGFGFNRIDPPADSPLSYILPEWRCSAVRLMALDSSFCFLAQAKLELQPHSEDKPATINAEDARLFLHNGRVWITYNSYNKATCAQLLQPIQFNPDKETSFLAHVSGSPSAWQGCRQSYGSSLEDHVRKQDGVAEDNFLALRTEKEMSLVEQSQSEDTFVLPGKNSGLFEYKGVLHYLWSVNPVRTATVLKSSEYGNKTYFLSGAHEYATGLDVHNSAHLIELPEHGILLGLAHRKHKVSNSTEGEARYRQAFFSLQNKPPFAMQASSDYFCIDSILRKGTCESTQSTFSMLRPSADPDKLIVSYGIQNCEGALVEFSLKSVLQDMRADGALNKDSVD